MISACQALWEFMLSANQEFRDLIFVESILVAGEIDELFKSGDWHKFPTIRDYSSVDVGLKKLNLNGYARDVHRLFVSERLWTIFAIHAAVLGRLGYLYSESHKEKRYRDWRKDRHFRSMLGDFIPDNVINSAMSRPVGGPALILQHLEAMFLKEALAIMSGTRTFAETIGDMGSTLLLEKERMARGATSAQLS
jgi:hypothetical protein